MNKLKCRVILLFFAAVLAIVAAPLRMARAQLPHLQNPSAPAFEVATVKQSATDEIGPNFMLAPARFSVNSAPLTELIQFAYDVKSDYQLPKSPAWIRSEKFDLDARITDADMDAIKKLPPDRKLDQYRLMVRSLLEDRFNLKVSRQMKELPIYELVLAKNGPKPALAPISPESQMRRTPTLSGFSHGEVKAGAVSMALFADWISGRPDTDDRAVVDATGLKGSFDFMLSWTPTNAQAAFTDAASGRGAAAIPDASGVSLLTALEEQLGLKFVPRRAPVEVLVIDHVDQPSPN